MKKSVLIVDDEPNIRESLARALQRAGYETSIAADGAEAEAINSQHRHDLVVLDLNMPVKNGWDTFATISTLDPLLPIIVITGRPGQSEIAAAARVGALMEKPLDVPLLLETVERLITEPLSARISRLAFRQPHTQYLGGDSSGDVENDPARLTALLRLRKEQLDDLRTRAGDSTTKAGNALHFSSQISPTREASGKGSMAPAPRAESDL